MPPPQFHTPVQLHQAVSTRARRHGKAINVDGGEIQRRWYLERLLARVFTHDPHGWLLKGGLALLVRYSQARHSRDLDLLHRSRDAAAELADRFLTPLLRGDAVESWDPTTRSWSRLDNQG
ncbi:nucleotidyltransferase AbiEii toxin of type IV toxin-antitoxin system [Halopolyspora algeriensis]|uniref:Nucleotidyltransferase AbiEii toxin of type IV toxin-antitoxin system n=1 Tax=Halopolyspora algeriensis TaxID=1500506 RepID=A0A368VP74_9ACTN|nr:nucleotidyl transferase AbiEii/AbiGii toxin family protein [Halopolyspora algeriensis]RCW43320.1 nucleotidyltransferase AbiEii toxin of type IV toxin-antitoxin system [Halopolyspora algeriensis]